MKKTRICLLLTFCMVLSVMSASCGRQDKVNSNGAAAASTLKIYYPNQDFTEIGGENAEAVSGDLTQRTGDLIRQLMTTPKDVRLKSVLGSMVSFNSFTVSNGSIAMDFDSDYLKLSKTAEVLFRASVVQTLTQLKDVKYVTISVKGSPLLDDNGDPVGIMTSNSFIDDTGTEINSYSKAKIRLYFTDREGKHLIADDEEFVYSSNISLEKLVAEKLIEGPSEGSSDFYPTIAPDAKLLSVTVKDRVCYVNFDAGLADKPYDVDENIVIYSIVDSLSELMEVDKVQIAIDGKTDRVLFDSMSLDKVYESNLDLVSDTDSGKE